MDQKDLHETVGRDARLAFVLSNGSAYLKFIHLKSSRVRQKICVAVWRRWWAAFGQNLAAVLAAMSLLDMSFVRSMEEVSYC